MSPYLSAGGLVRRLGVTLPGRQFFACAWVAGQCRSFAKFFA